MKKITSIFLAAFLFTPFNVQAAFTDLPDEHPNKEAIDYLAEFDVIQGDDVGGTVRPNDEINRAEFVVVLLRLLENQEPAWPTSNCFPNVKTQWFAADVCEAKFKEIISGYPDGTFRPWENISLVEALKVIVNVLEVPTSEIEGGEWYDSYLEAMSQNNYLPDSLSALDQKITRGEMAEMTWRVLLEKKDQPYTTSYKLKNPCLPLGEDLPDSIDMDRFRTTWLEWVNDARAAQGLHPYKYNHQLSRTATNWSNLAAVRGYIDHRRDPGDAYYDYWKITDWFANLGLTFENVSGVTHTENIGWDVFSCNEADCTDEALSDAGNVFKFYMDEGPGGAHYNTIMNAYFNELGMGVALAADNRIYITTHYATGITSDPYPVCEFL